ncbi:endonuclease I [Escherichia phage ZG49]|uniref:Endonuclease I n=1 Tax=Escherichia phage ZG49 TaxID=1897641 RepID=A0A286SG87_9CAUD|nr:endonuclease [Escherichia phage ZG49]ATB23422.1 endonuclease I [Escherichia phage ZG49]
MGSKVQFMPRKSTDAIFVHCSATKPEMDIGVETIRMVFSSSRSKLYKGSPTTYGAWCEKNGFKFADKFIPVEWLREVTVRLPSGILIPKKKGVKDIRT